jgi:hypothetical protein
LDVFMSTFRARSTQIHIDSRGIYSTMPPFVGSGHPANFGKLK